MSAIHENPINNNQVVFESLSAKNEKCPICFEQIPDGQGFGHSIGKVNHVFHKSCIDGWISQHHTCPTCRREVKPLASQADTVASRSISRQHELAHVHDYQDDYDVRENSYYVPSHEIDDFEDFFPMDLSFEEEEEFYPLSYEIEPVINMNYYDTDFLLIDRFARAFFEAMFNDIFNIDFTFIYSV